MPIMWWDKSVTYLLTLASAKNNNNNIETNRYEKNKQNILVVHLKIYT